MSSASIMAANRFSSVLEYKEVILSNPSDIVKHSFILQNSLSHLDLELSQSYRLRSSILDNYRTYSSYNTVINTEEKCQKLHSESRRQLYKLHLDMPKGRDWNLRSASFPKYITSFKDVPCVGRIKIDRSFYTNKMRGFFHYACVNTPENEKVLKWFMERQDLKRYNIDLPLHILNHFIDHILVESTDLEFVKKCFTRLPFRLLLRYDTKPERVRDLFHLVHSKGGRPEREIWRCEFSDRCFLHPSFLYVGEALKFTNAPHICRSFSSLLTGGILLGRNCSPAAGLINSIDTGYRRGRLLLHLFWTYRNKSVNPSAASESLRLVWNSINDSFLSCNEITSQFKMLDSEEVADICDFYSEAVGEYQDDFNPRPLKHLCRSEIRYRLWESMQWLPEGIEQLGLPTKLQSYLKLEKQLQ